MNQRLARELEAAVLSGAPEQVAEVIRRHASELTPKNLAWMFKGAVERESLPFMRFLADLLRANPILLVEALTEGARWAALYGRLEILKFLVHQGADPHTRDGEETLMHLAAWGRGDGDTLRWLAQFIEVDEPGPDGVTALMLAARTLLPEPVLALRELGADAARADRKGRQAMDYAQRGLADSVFEPDWQENRERSSYGRPSAATPAPELYAEVRQALAAHPTDVALESSR